MSEQTVPCQTCRGAGEIGPVHVNRGDQPHEWRENMTCVDCGGAGSWDMARWERWQVGRRHRQERIARDESMYECARRLGVEASDISEFEHGRKHLPTPPA